MGHQYKQPTPIAGAGPGRAGRAGRGRRAADGEGPGRPLSRVRGRGRGPAALRGGAGAGRSVPRPVAPSARLPASTPLPSKPTPAPIPRWPGRRRHEPPPLRLTSTRTERSATLRDPRRPLRPPCGSSHRRRPHRSSITRPRCRNPGTRSSAPSASRWSRSSLGPPPGCSARSSASKSGHKSNGQRYLAGNAASQVTLAVRLFRASPGWRRQPGNRFHSHRKNACRAVPSRRSRVATLRHARPADAA